LTGASDCQNAPLAGIAYLFLVSGEPSAQCALHGLPLLLALRQVRLGNQNVYQAIGKIDPQPVTLLQQADWPAFGGFRRYTSSSSNWP